MENKKVCELCKNTKSDWYWYAMPQFEGNTLVGYKYAHKNCCDKQNHK